jgi:methyl-accepting chemotaxis protein
MFKKISVKIAVLVNIVLFVPIVFGTALLVKKQYSSLETNYQEQGKFISSVGAKAVGRLIEEAVDNGVFSVADAFDTEYSVIPNFDPPKYHTKYDSYMDKAILSLQDEMLKNPNIVFAVTVDKNGYLPTHNTKFQQPISGDKEKDKVGNRTKRIFNDPVGLAAARNTQDGFIQVYKRDTGETMWDVSTPINVKGKFWGNFRIGLSIDSLQDAKKALLYQMTGIMAIILIISIVSIFFTVRYILLPLTALTQIASKMADGEVNDKIDITSQDEIGDLADVLERMRISLKTAMDRLMKK